MAARHTYSRWDGTQHGFDLDADSVFDALTDDLIEHGDLNAALRRLMNDGLRSRSGEPSPGLRELLERLRRARQERLERHDLGGVYDEIARELDDIIDEERHAIDRDRLEARQMSERTGDPRRSEVAEAAAEERLFRLDLLPDDLAGKVAELQRYDFTSASAEGRLEALLERLRAQLANQMFESMSGAMQQMTPESVGRMKDMMAALNEMLERQRRGEDPGFEEFMERYGDFFPEQPETLDELLESLAKRMAAMQAMLNSMTPEQRAQLQQLAEQLLGDLDLQWQMDRLGSNLRALAPGEGWDASYDFSGNDPLGLAEAMQAMAELGELDQLEGLLRGVSAPTALAEADMDRVRDLLGDDAAPRPAAPVRADAPAHRGRSDRADRSRPADDPPRHPGDRCERTARSVRRPHQGPARTAPAPTPRARARVGRGHEAVRVRRPVPPRPAPHVAQRAAPAQRQRDAQTGTPVRLEPDDFEIERTEHVTRSSTVLMLDLSMSMPMEGRFVPAKKVAMALHSLISTQFPRDYLGVVVFSETARVIAPERIPEASWDYVYGTNMHHTFTLARHLLARQSGTRQIIMVTDGEPTAHITPDGEVFFHYPAARETVEATLREVLRCTRAGIRINTFMLGASPSLKAFVERISEINHGRAFFTTPETLGDYVLVDFIDHKRQRSRSRRVS